MDNRIPMVRRPPPNALLPPNDSYVPPPSTTIYNAQRTRGVTPTNVESSPDIGPSVPAIPPAPTPFPTPAPVVNSTNGGTQSGPTSLPTGTTSTSVVHSHAGPSDLPIARPQPHLSRVKRGPLTSMLDTHNSCILCGFTLCNMSIIEGTVLLIAFVFEILLGVWLFLVPSMSQLLWAAMIFILGVIFPSPVFSPLITRGVPPPDQQSQMLDNYQRAINIESGVTTVTHQPTGSSVPVVTPTGGTGGASGPTVTPLPNSNVTIGSTTGTGENVVTPLPAPS